MIVDTLAILLIGEIVHVHGSIYKQMDKLLFQVDNFSINFVNHVYSEQVHVCDIIS